MHKETRGVHTPQSQWTSYSTESSLSLVFLSHFSPNSKERAGGIRDMHVLFGGNLKRTPLLLSFLLSFFFFFLHSSETILGLPSNPYLRALSRQLHPVDWVAKRRERKKRRDTHRCKKHMIMKTSEPRSLPSDLLAIPTTWKPTKNIQKREEQQQQQQTFFCESRERKTAW